ncbi:carotenoid 1,2-hydratase [Pyxidicoccus fallax]|uniref:Carotenoid 1,2-hydratase n=1 Tax=Pyxidicoccus fallax TaxID=394095 RepID=A0A848LGD8_9BACT|nr:lipocalin-like domain-containing protein [Pyxidicoccus fallax]NMO16315.1 carotenoid 1,2-hydratase [Pyxidicoccus fallax]NPC82266.1 carotenoid 1,2-hydratase [Pyxidicoccus fallax]
MSGGRGLVIGTAVVLAALAVVVVVVTHESRPPELPQGGSLTVTGALGGGEAAGTTEGYARAVEPRPFQFPEDHGPHPEFRTEWWYWTGNLETEDGRAFGYQFTLFRSALAPEAPARTSAWGARQVYLGHFTVTDVAGGGFQAAERFSRSALELAGASTRPFKVWLEDWEASSVGESTWPMRLRAETDAVALELLLEPGKPPVLQGDRGLSQKGPERGNASYYYSMTRMPSRGTVRVDGKTYEVKGESWMDREWSTSALGADQVGWDWFSLQLSDGSELMYYQLRRKDGSADPFSSGMWVPPAGSGSSEPVRVSREDVRLTVLDTWKSPRSGGEYPARWRLHVEKLGLDLTVTPRLADQELPVSVIYWEGSVGLEGSREGKPLTGRGYVELTGYADTQGQQRRESRARGVPEAETAADRPRG